MSRNRGALPRRRWLQACGIVGLGTVAGCLDEVDELGEENGDDSDLEFPSGVSEDGIEDGEELFETHTEETTATSFVLEYEHHYTSEQDGESSAAVDAFRLVAEPEADQVTKREFDAEIDSDFERGVYIDGDERATSDDESLAQRGATDVVDDAFETASTYIPHVEAEYDGTTEIDSKRVHKLEITGSESQHVNGELQDVSGSIYVDDAGRIHRYRERQTALLEDQEIELEITITCSEFGSATVSEPEWLEEPESSGGSEPIEPGTRIELAAETVGWIGVEPGSIDGEENPTLVLEGGKEYEIGWVDGDELEHNIELRDENDDVVGGSVGERLETGYAIAPAENQWIQFEASEEIATYVCAPHAAQMRGEIEIV